MKPTAPRHNGSRQLLAVVAGFFFAAPGAADVEFSGLNDAQEANVRALMPLAEARCDAARWRVERLHRDAPRQLRHALEALGYYNATVSSDLQWSENCWNADFTVDIGEPVRLETVEIRADGAASSDEELRKAIAAGPLGVGQTLHHGDYEYFKRRFIGTALGRGYFDAEYSVSEVTVDREANSATVNLTLDSGDRYRFGATVFGTDILNDRLLQSFSDIEAGDFYSSAAVNELYDALSGSSYFGAVSIITEPLDRDARTVPVQVELSPGVRLVYSIGAGFATDTGPQGRLGFANRRINTRGHQFESRLFASAVKSELTAAYRLPGRDPRKDWLTFSSGFRAEDTDTSRSDTFKLGAQLSRSLSKRWLRTRYLDYEREEFRVADQDTSSQLFIFGTNFESTVGRELVRSRKGYRLSFDARAASDSLGSDTSFLQLRASAKWIHSLSDRWRVLARTRVGTTLKDELTELPASVRFFAGGDRSVRGYDFEDLGPLDDNGEVTGGSHLAEASLEIDYRWGEQWAVAAFADTGSAFNDTDIELSSGVGLGLRWYSPVGPIRLDIAHPLDDPDTDVRLHISLGPDL